MLPASPTVPISTEILLCDVTNVPEPNPAKINIRFWNVKGFNINRVLANRAINSKGGKRGGINEIIVTNY